MAKSPRYRYKLELVINSTNKKEFLEELETIMLFARLNRKVSHAFCGDNGSCFVEGALYKRAGR